MLVTVDTLRADHLSCNGSEQVETPNLDRIAAEGVNFTRARSPVPLTLPAHASILTGSYPPTHTIRDNGQYRLPESELSLAEVLERQGLRSFAVVGSFVLDRRYGLNQGFESYDDRVWTDINELENLEAERTADEVFTAFKSWMRFVEYDQRFFAWVHLYDPHAPYMPPEPHRGRYEDNPYAGEVAYVDEVIGKLLGVLDETERTNRTIVALVGDHGEALGAHGEATHSLLIYNSTLHVPMMIRAPGLIRPGLVVDRLVRTIDLAPTILDLLELGEELGEGRSLKPLFGGDEMAGSFPDLTSYSESLYPELHLGWSPLYGIETEEYRLIEGAVPELFNISNDPAESVDLVQQDSEVYKDLQKRLAEIRDSGKESVARPELTDDEQASIERLQSLGYLSGSANSGRRGAEARREDPREKLQAWNGIQSGIALFGRRDYLGAAQAFREVLTADPDILMAYEYLAASLLQLSQPEQAGQVYERALERNLESSQVRLELGKILLTRGDVKEAIPELERAVALDERNVKAHYFLGNAYRSAESPKQAVEQYRLAVRLNPSYLWGWNGLGMAQASLGSNQEALTAFRRAIDVDPQGARGYFNLAVHLERTGSKEEAIRSFERFLELSENQGLEKERTFAEAALGRLRS